MRKTLFLLVCVSVVSLFSCQNDKAEQTEAMTVPTMDQLTLGKDYTDLSANIQFLTHRTDIVDTKFKDYVAEFNKMYPNIKITYEGVTDYASDVIVRLTTKEWGDVMMIPTTVDKNELPNLFVPFGSLSGLSQQYRMLSNFAYQDTVYGIPSTGNAQGIVYNKKVFEAAGITELPKTPDEFMAALKKIKANTKAIPLYTNFAAGWTMGAWDAYIGGSATGSADYMNQLPHWKDPFSNRGDGTGPYAVYNVLYEAVAQGLTEDDPTTTDWEGSKSMINRGEIGCMVLGSWAVVQMQDAGPNADDIGYMPFPISIDGKQYASAGPDYNYGINVNSSDANKIASLLYIKFLTEQSNFAYSEGGIPIDVSLEYPPLYAAFSGAEFVVDNPAPAGEETLFNDMNNESEIGINRENSHIQAVLESALQKNKTMDQIAQEWNEKWSRAQEKLGVDITYP